MSPFTLEGSMCFAVVPPGMEIRIELYDHYPNGDRRYLVRLGAIPPKPRPLQDAEIDEECR